jgi:hypothetical protein
MKAGIAFSTDRDSWQAGRKAAEGAMESSGQPVLTILFTTDSYDQERVFEAVREVVGDSKIVGFCSGGIITSDEVLNKGVGVCILGGDELKVATSLQEGLSKDPYSVGQRAGKELLASGIDKGTVFVFPDGFGANISEMVRGVYNAMGPDFKYLGGGAGDNLRFFKTYQFTERGIASDALAVAVLDGIKNRVAIGHGWRPKGEPVIIGDAEGKRVFEIDGRPAFEAYSERLGGITVEDFPEYGMKYPLGFPDISGNYLIRDPLRVNPDQSIEFVTEVPSNAVGYIMEGNVEELIETAGSVGEKAAKGIVQPQFALCLDCISRYMLLGEEFKRELEVIKEAVGKNIPIIGALTFGEVGSYVDEVPLFHNKTLVLTVCGSEKEGSGDG